jgi:hypothetical protein
LRSRRQSRECLHPSGSRAGCSTFHHSHEQASCSSPSWGSKDRAWEGSPHNPKSTWVDDACCRSRHHEDDSSPDHGRDHPSRDHWPSCDCQHPRRSRHRHHQPRTSGTRVFWQTSCRCSFGHQLVEQTRCPCELQTCSLPACPSPGVKHLLACSPCGLQSGLLACASVAGDSASPWQVHL